MERMLEATRRAEDAHFWFRGLRRTARQLIDAARGRALRRIVDCGAGTGRNLDWLREYGDAVGVELSPTGLAAGRADGRRLVADRWPHCPSRTRASIWRRRSTCSTASTMRPSGSALGGDVARAQARRWSIVNVAALDILARIALDADPRGAAVHAGPSARRGSWTRGSPSSG